MPKCYSVILCSSSSLDRYSNNWSLFNITEELRLELPAPPSEVSQPQIRLPLELHSFWDIDPGEITTAFEIRYIVIDENGAEYPQDANIFEPSKSRHRLRIQVLIVPLYTGRLQIYMEWREQDQGIWNRSKTSWPLDIEIRLLETETNEEQTLQNLNE